MENIPEEEETINESQQILPSLSKLYEFDVDDTEKQIIITVTFPESFDPDTLTVKLHRGHDAIAIEAPDILPIVKGTLLAPVNSMRKRIDDQHLIVTLQKQERGLWETFIVGPYPDTDEIDPQSAFAIGVMFSRVQSEMRENFMLLSRSADMGYVPAMCLLANFYTRADDPTGYSLKNAAMQLYNRAIEKYNSAPAMVACADYILREGANNAFAKGYAISLLKKAVDQDNEVAHYYLGHAYSPLSKIKGVTKDAKEAIKEFELAGDKNPDALHEMAMLYFNGVGVKKDLAKANDLQLKAKRLDKNIEILHKPKMGYGPRFMIFLILLTLALLCGFGWNEFIKATSK